MIEGSLASQHLVCKNADRPNVHETIVRFSFQDLGTDVVESATVSCPAVFAVGRPPEIAKLADSVGQDNVFRLDISMEDIFFMKVVQRSADFSHSGDCFLLCQSLFGLDHLVKSSFFHVLHHDIEARGVVEEAIHFYNVRVVEEEADLQLLRELLQHQSH